VGMTELNGLDYTVTFVDTDHFDIDVDSTLFTPYDSLGYWTQINMQYFTLPAQYAWHRFFASCYGQFISLRITYDNSLMSQLRTHQQNFVLNAMQMYFKDAGKNIFGK